ncbi:PepSY domain-containing protein [Leptospira sp. 96542]|nr:PepSY domain-containing protein [Leptospira sp. 96542]
MNAAPAAAPSATASALYRRVWRWHFYAGLICLPVLALMAVTGALYLYQEPIESLVYTRLRSVDASMAPATSTALDAESLVAHAQTAVPGEAVRFIAAPQAGRSAEVGIRTDNGRLVSVYLDPASGQVLGQLPDDEKLMEIVKRVHSLAIAGPVANHGVEIVAGWAIVLVASGVFLWWPRGRTGTGGVYSLRGRPTQRNWWRDLHAVVGVTAGAAIVFLAVTGMPWSAYWGQQFGRLTNAWGIGLPMHLFGPAPASSLPSSAPSTLSGDLPWTLSQARLPPSTPPAQANAHEGAQSAAHADAHADPHGEHAGHDAHGAPGSALPQTALAPSIGLNAALRRYAELGLPAGTPVRLPQGPSGAYTAMSFPDDVRDQRVVHLDRYSGAVLADVGYADYGIAGRVTEWGINLHTGRQFGALNRLVMLAGCLSIVALAISAVVMWWKRRPQGRLAAPPRRAGDRAAWSAIAVAALLGLLYPLLGASMLAALLVDAVVPQRWHARWGL